MDKYDDIVTILDENVQFIMANLPKDVASLEVLDAAEAGGKDRKMVRRAIGEALSVAQAEQAEAIPEPVGDWPTHDHAGRKMCLVPRYRLAGDEVFHYVLRPLKDIHPLVIKEVRARLENAGGDLIWVDPYKCDSMEWEPLPPAINAQAPGADYVTTYGPRGKVTDSEIIARW